MGDGVLLNLGYPNWRWVKYGGSPNWRYPNEKKNVVPWDDKNKLTLFFQAPLKSIQAAWKFKSFPESTSTESELSLTWSTKFLALFKDIKISFEIEMSKNEVVFLWALRAHKNTTPILDNSISIEILISLKRARNFVLQVNESSDSLLLLSGKILNF